MMDAQCLVICGTWDMMLNGEWNFVIDKGKLSRNVPIKEGISLSELKSVIAEEFEVNVGTLSLSYWLKNSFEFVTGRKTPPVLVTTDIGLGSFLKLLEENRDMNLFVSIAQKRAREDEDVRSSVTKKASSVLVNDLSGGSLSSPVVDEDFLAEVEEVEAKLGNSGVKRGPIVREVNPSSSVGSGEADNRRVNGTTSSSEGGVGLGTNSVWSSDFSDGWDDVERSDDGFDVPVWEDCEDDCVPDEVPVPRSYDTEFWGPLLDDEFGGSDAVEVMCSSNDAFDHSVLLNSHGNLKPEMKTDGVPSIPYGYGQTPVDGVPSVGKDSSRKLSEVDDDEFDIASLFDDTLYERDDIPDLDYDDEKGIYVGQLFANKIECQIALALYAIKNMFHYKQTKTRRDLFVVSCSDEKCGWRILAKETRDYGYYEIRKAELEHSCSTENRSKFMKKATSRVIAHVCKPKFGTPGKNPNTYDLQQLVIDELRITASYMKCWRAKEKATVDVCGSDEDSYMNLAEYLHVLERSNPGTITDIKTEIDEETGADRFLYMFLAFGASIAGLKHLRRVIVVDGTHLSGKYKGVLLTASGQDGNFQVFPIAFAVVDSENDESWTWFLEKVSGIIADSQTLSIISDRHQSIYKAKKLVYPLAHHGACVIHLERNITSRYKNKGLAKMVRNAAYAWTVGEFKSLYEKVRAKNMECAKYLEKIGMAHWTRVYFRGMRYNLMTSNIAESLNNALKAGRSSHIVELLKFIRSMMTRWFNSRRTKSLKQRGELTPEVDKELLKRRKATEGSQIGIVSSWSVEVIGKFSGKHHVLLNDKKCNCKQYDRLQIPCGHAMVAAESRGIPVNNLVGSWYKTSTWQATYAGVVNPEVQPKDVEIPREITDRVILPPRTKRPSGRPKEARIPSKGEFGKMSGGKVRVNRCSRCKRVGHNRVKCSNPI